MKKLLEKVVSGVLVLTMVAATLPTQVLATQGTNSDIAVGTEQRVLPREKQEAQVTQDNSPAPNSPEYADWKAALVAERRASNTPDHNGPGAPLLSVGEERSHDWGYIQNSYVQAYINTNGTYTIGMGDGVNMLFGHPGAETTETLVRIDGEDYWFDDYVNDVEFSADSTQCTATATIDGVEVKQILSLIHNSQTSCVDTVKIAYSYTNNDSISKRVGIRIMLDTMVENNDGAPFYVNNQPITTEVTYSGSDIPQYWTTMNRLDNPSKLATGVTYRSGELKPNKIQFATWPEICGSSWNYTTTQGKSLVNDSAVAIYYNEATLHPSATKHVATYYGAFSTQKEVIYPEFNYDNDTYSKDLAILCGKFSAYAYGDYLYNKTDDFFYGGNTASRDAINKALPAVKIKGIKYNFNNIKYWDSTGEHGSPHTIASTRVLHNGVARDLVFVIMRGTKKVEWYGNMDITGSYYDSGEWTHTSFQKAANEIKADLIWYIKKYELQDCMVMVTGHSRGGGVGNLLAEELTNSIVEGVNPLDIYAYLFAVPNCAKQPRTNMSNIYNFVFEDDFVASVPLSKSGWNYGKHGVTFERSAQSLYSNSKDFAKYAEASLNGKMRGTWDVFWNKPSFKLNATKNVCDHVYKTWSSAKNYYEKSFLVYHKEWDKDLWVYWDVGHYVSLYNFMHDYIAPFRAGGISFAKVSKVLDSFDTAEFKPVSDFFLEGSILGSINDTHQMYTYYAALKTGGFTGGSSYTLGGPLHVVLGEDAVPVEREVAALKAFAQTGENLTALGWDLDAPMTWEGITWGGETQAHVTEINLYYKELSGTLDLSDFSELERLDISGCGIEQLVLDGCNSLAELYCPNNELTEIDFAHLPLVAFDCTGNYLNIEAQREQFDTLQERNVLLNCDGQRVPPESTYHEDDVKALKKLQPEAGPWDFENETPGEWYGVGWEEQDGVYRVTSLDLSGIGLSGELKIELPKLTELVCKENDLTLLDLSACGELKIVDCAINQIAEITLAPEVSLAELSCAENYLAPAAMASLAEQVDEQGVTDFGKQYIGAELSQFSAQELDVLADFAVGMAWDMAAPGQWQEASWVLQADGLYHVTRLNLDQCEGITGTVDFSEFSALTDISMAQTGAETIILPDTVTEIGDDAFANCGALKTVHMSDELTAIGDRAFLGCELLEIDSFPLSLERIGEKAFFECKGLRSAWIYAALTELGSQAFAGCEQLAEVVFTGDLPEGMSDGAFACCDYNLRMQVLIARDGWQDYMSGSVLPIQGTEPLVLQQLPDKMEYSVGDELTTDGMSLYWISENGTKETVENGSADLSIQYDFSAAGPATVTMEYKTATATFDVKVYPVVTQIVLSETELMLYEGQSRYLEFDLLPSEASTAKIIWSSTDPTVVDVSEGGLFAVDVGTATVTACSLNGVSASCAVTVKELVPLAETLQAEMTDSFTATISANFLIPINTGAYCEIRYGYSEDALEYAEGEYFDNGAQVEYSRSTDAAVMPDSVLYYQAVMAIDGEEYFGEVKRLATGPFDGEELTVDTAIEITQDMYGQFRFVPEQDGVYYFESENWNLALEMYDFERGYWKYIGESYFRAEKDTAYYFKVYGYGECTLTLKQYETQVTEFALTETYVQSDEDEFTTIALISAAVPMGSSFRIGIEYGLSKENTREFTSHFWEEMSESVTVSFTMPVVSNEQYYYRAHIWDEQTDEAIFGQWETFTTGDFNGTQLALDTPVTMSAYSDHYLRYVPEEDGYYSFGVESYAGVELRVYNRTTMHWDYIAAEEMLRLEKDVPLHIVCSGYGDYTLTLSRFKPQVTEFAVSEVYAILGESSFEMYVFTEAEVLFGSDFSVGMEYGLTKNSTYKSELDFQTWMQEYASVSLLAEVMPGYQYYYRGYVRDDSTDEVFYGQWKTFTAQSFVGSDLEPDVAMTIQPQAENLFRFVPQQDGYHRLTTSDEILAVDMLMPGKNGWRNYSADDLIMLEEGVAVYLDVHANEPGALAIGHYVPQVTQYTVETGEVDYVTDIELGVWIHASMPVGTDMKIGVEYGTTMSNCFTYTTRRHSSSAFEHWNEVFRLEVIPDTLYYYRAFVENAVTGQKVYGDWKTVRTAPSTAESLTLNSPTALDWYGGVYVFVPTQSGYYNVSATNAGQGVLGVGVEEWTWHDWRGVLSYSTYMHAGVPVYLQLWWESDVQPGTKIRVTPFTPSVTTISTPEMAHMVSGCKVSVSASASVPLGFTGELGVEYRSAQPGSEASEDMYMFYVSGQETLEFGTELLLLPGKEYIIRPVLRDTDNDTVYYGNEVSVTTVLDERTVKLVPGSWNQFGDAEEYVYSFTAEQEGLYLLSARAMHAEMELITETWQSRWNRFQNDTEIHAVHLDAGETILVRIVGYGGSGGRIRIMEKPLIAERTQEGDAQVKFVMEQTGTYIAATYDSQGRLLETELVSHTQTERVVKEAVFENSDEATSVKCFVMESDTCTPEELVRSAAVLENEFQTEPF